MIAHRMSAAGLAGIALLLAAGCGGKDEAAAVDNELVADANAADPALTGALEDQIMVDPALTQQSNANSARPPAQPLRAPVPAAQGGAPARAAAGALLEAPAPRPAGSSGKLTLGQLAEVQGARAGGGANCLRDVQYSATWATRLPAAFPVYPDGQVAEAAGNDRPDCRLRVVSFTSPTPIKSIVDWYYTRAVRAGYSAEHLKDGAEHSLGGTQAKGDGAFIVFLRPKGAGTEVDLVASGGR